DSTGWALWPTGFLRKGSSCLLRLSSFPRLLLAQARVGPTRPKQFGANRPHAAAAGPVVAGVRSGAVAQALAKGYEALIARHRIDSLELGAALGPCAEDRVEVRALEDAEALEAAQPRWLGGELFDPAAVRAREDAMAKRLAEAKE